MRLATKLSLAVTVTLIASPAFAHLDPVAHGNTATAPHAFDGWHVAGTLGLVAMLIVGAVGLARRLRLGRLVRQPVSSRRRR